MIASKSEGLIYWKLAYQRCTGADPPATALGSGGGFWQEDAGGRWSKEREVTGQVTTGQLEILQRRKVVKLKGVNKTTLMNKESDTKRNYLIIN